MLRVLVVVVTEELSGAGAYVLVLLSFFTISVKLISDFESGVIGLETLPVLVVTSVLLLSLGLDGNEVGFVLLLDFTSEKTRSVNVELFFASLGGRCGDGSLSGLGCLAVSGDFRGHAFAGDSLVVTRWRCALGDGLHIGAVCCA